MELLYGIGIAIGWILILPILRMLITFMHEMGHAIPALLLTNGPVDVYLGSHGRSLSTHTWKLGRLQFFFTWDIMDWQIGMCVPHGKSSLVGLIIIILGGPVSSALISGVFLMLAVRGGYGEGVVILLMIIFLLGLLDLVVNLVPAATKYRNTNGEIVMSDGRQLIQFFQNGRMSDDFIEIEELVHNGETEQAISLLKDKINSGDDHEIYYRLLIQLYNEQKDHESVIQMYEKYAEIHPLKKDDYRTIGLAYYKNHNHEKSIRFLNEYLFTEFADYEATYTRGLIRMNDGDMEEAYKDFKSAIHYAPDEKRSFPLGQIAYLFLKDKNIESAKEMLEQANKQKMAELNPSLAFYIAMYQEKTGSYAKALESYKKAEAMGHPYHGYDYKYYDLETMMK